MMCAPKIATGNTSIKKTISIIVMAFGLMLLTGANFVVYADYFKCKNCNTELAASDTEAPNPVEEKSKSGNNGPTVQEEYLHDKHTTKELIWLQELLKHRIMDSEKLEIVHYELASPPPKA